jgi:DNA repair protein RadD
VAQQELARPQLRPYQRDDIARITAAYDRARRVLYQAPTGSGKTVLAAAFIGGQTDEHILVVAHRDEIVLQISSALTTLDIAHGIIAPGYPETAERVQVASVMTLARRL